MKVPEPEWPEIPDPEGFKLMAGPLELPADVHEQIEKLCEAGDALSEEKKYDEAIVKYRAALFLIPRPLEKWDASTWVYSAIGDAYFLKGDFQSARKPWRDVMYCPGAEENPFIRLRRGQVAFEVGNLPVAKKELEEAYQLDEDILNDEDPKYLKFLKSGAP